MQVDAGEEGILSSPERMIDPDSGQVTLRLFPVHIETRDIYPPELRGRYVPCGGDPDSPYEFPLLKKGPSVDLVVRGGMAPRELQVGGLTFECAGDFRFRTWWRWIASALTPMGWVNHPTPQFAMKREGVVRDSSLAYLDLMPSCLRQFEDFEVAEKWLFEELGDPHSRGEGLIGRDWLEREPPFNKAWGWSYDWGDVILWYTYDDYLAEVLISWRPFAQEAMREA